MALFVALASTTVASEKVFYGRWEPPVSLRVFWTPIKESWLNPYDTSTLVNHCKHFAKHSSPQLIPTIIADLKAHPSVERTLVYSLLILNWDRRVTLALLEPYYQTSDPDIHKIASDFIADIEELQEEARQKQR